MGNVLAILVVVGSLLTGAFFYGKSSCQQAVKDAERTERERQDKGADRLETVKVVYRDRVKEVIRDVQQAPDPTGCAKTDMPAAVIERLGGVRHADGVARPGATTRLGDPRPAP